MVHARRAGRRHRVLVGGDVEGEVLGDASVVAGERRGGDAVAGWDVMAHRRWAHPRETVPVHSIGLSSTVSFPIRTFPPVTGTGTDTAW